MRRQRALVAVALGVCLGVLTGCGNNSKYVPVSGVVRVNGKAYANASVFFQPVGGKEDPNPGRGSSGLTDTEGKYSLKTSEGIDGALIGSHQIKILTNSADTVGFDAAVGSRDDAPAPQKGKVDPIPPDWRTMGKHTFEVPPGGTDQANFDIENPAVKK